jgi:signal peptidase I
MEEENKLAESAVEKEELEQTQAESNDSNEQKEPVEEKTEETEEPSNETEVKNEENEEKKPDTKKTIFDVAEIVTISIVVVFLLVTFSFRLASVNGKSMYPTLKDGEILVVTNLFYQPKSGDIIVFQQSNMESRIFDYPLVKRVIATEGQTIEFDFANWRVTVDGVELDEEYVNYIKGTGMKREDITGNKIIVPEGYLFVMGDNRYNSTDSCDKRVSFVRKDEVLGKVLIRLFPLSSFGFVGK